MLNLFAATPNLIYFILSYVQLNLVVGVEFRADMFTTLFLVNNNLNEYCVSLCMCNYDQSWSQ